MNVDKNEIVKEYDKILIELYKKQEEAAIKKAEESIDKLDRFNIAAWPYGMKFYRDEQGIKWGNIAGVLITAIFLTFGAPFWFSRLQEAVNLRDILSKGIKPETKKGDGNVIIRKV